MPDLAPLCDAYHADDLIQHVFLDSAGCRLYPVILLALLTGLSLFLSPHDPKKCLERGEEVGREGILLFLKYYLFPKNHPRGYNPSRAAAVQRTGQEATQQSTAARPPTRHKSMNTPPITPPTWPVFSDLADLCSTYLFVFVKLLPFFKVFERFSSSQNLELQQRSCEYLGLPDMGIDVMEEVGAAPFARLHCLRARVILKIRFYLSPPRQLSSFACLCSNCVVASCVQSCGFRSHGNITFWCGRKKVA